MIHRSKGVLSPTPDLIEGYWSHRVKSCMTFSEHTIDLERQLCDIDGANGVVSWSRGRVVLARSIEHTQVA